MPSSNPLSRLFGRSPFGPLQEHIAKTCAATKLLRPFIEALMAQHWQEAARIREQISTLEHQADDLKRDIRLHLPNSLFLPVARSDVLELVALQDKIANRAKDIAGLMLGRQMVIPAPLTTSVLEFIQSGIDAVEQAEQSIQELDELIESGFGKQVTELIGQMLQRLDELEHQADRQEVDLRAQLFQMEHSLPPVEVIFLYKIIDWIGELSDRAQRVGGRLQIMMAR